LVFKEYFGGFSSIDGLPKNAVELLKYVCMFNGKRILAIIPARGRSKRIPRKNIKLLDGKPLIAYTIEAGLHCSAIDRLIVSTDDQETADVAKAMGVDVPFLRPAELSGDSTPDQPVAQHVLEELEEMGESFDILVWLRPTTPFKRATDIDAALDALERAGAPLVRSVTPVEGVFHPYWMYRGDGVRSTQLMDIHFEDYLRSQNLPNDVFRLNGVVDAIHVKHVRESSTMYVAQDMGYIVIPQERATDIDEPIDFAWAEFLLTHDYVQR
jgi:CMP-N-acetylneuraminic acid synthetase